MPTELRSRRLTIAARHWRNAKQDALELHSRAAAALDAGYTYTLVLADAPAGLHHPNRGILKRQGADAAAFEFLEFQYSSQGPGQLWHALMTWAMKMKALAEAG